MSEVGSWAAVYGKVGLDELQPFDLVVVDPRVFPKEELVPGRRSNGPKYLIAYLSIGEISERASDFHRVRGSSALAERNAAWESWRVDVRDTTWQSYILEYRIPQILEAGFDGIMLDTVSAAADLERRFPDRYYGSTKAMKNFILWIRKSMPRHLLLVNGGLETVASIASRIDGMIVESIWGGFDPIAQKYLTSRSPQEREKLLARIKEIRDASGTRFFAVDYFSGAGGRRRAKSERRYQELGILPYFGPGNLQTVSSEP